MSAVLQSAASATLVSSPALAKPELKSNVVNVAVRVNPKGEISCEPNQVVVSGQNVLINFSLQSELWAFPDTDAVKLKQPSDQFPFPAWTLGHKQVVLLDCDTSAGDYAYTVTVQNIKTGELRRLDPSIRNES